MLTTRIPFFFCKFLINYIYIYIYEFKKIYKIHQNSPWAANIRILCDIAQYLLRRQIPDFSI